MNEDYTEIEYDVNGDNFEYCQELTRHSEDFYGLDLSTSAYEQAMNDEYE